MASETVFTFTNVPLDTAGILPLTSYSGSLLINMNTGTVTGALTVAPALGIDLTTYTSFTIAPGLGGTYTITGTGQTASLVSSTITIQYTGITPTAVSTHYSVLGVELASGSGSPITTATALQPSVVPETASALSGMTATATAGTGVLQGASDPNGGTLSVYSVSNGATTDTIASGSSATVTGTYGSLTLGSDGSYSYAANNGLVSSQRLTDRRSPIRSPTSWPTRPARRPRRRGPSRSTSVSAGSKPSAICRMRRRRLVSSISARRG